MCNLGPDITGVVANTSSNCVSLANFWLTNILNSEPEALQKTLTKTKFGYSYFLRLAYCLNY